MKGADLRPQLELRVPMDMALSLQIYRVNTALGEWVAEIGTNYRISLNSIEQNREDNQLTFVYEAVSGGKGERYS